MILHDQPIKAIRTLRDRARNPLARLPHVGNRKSTQDRNQQHLKKITLGQGIKV